MNVYYNDYDTIAAEDLDDLKRMLLDGFISEDEFEADEWRERDPDSSLTIWFYTAEEVPGQASVEIRDERFFATMRSSEWAAFFGRGMICSTEV